MRHSHCDILILGAGVAGLACAGDLSRKNSKIIIVDARAKAGGRIRTLQQPGSSVPMELGAEFLHGASTEVVGLSESLQLPFYDVSDRHLFLKNGHLKMIPDFFGHLDKLMPTKNRRRDETIESFLRKKKLSTTWRNLFAAYVEGFHAADLGVMGVQGLASSMETRESSLNGQEMFRFVSGYNQLVTGLADAVEAGSFRYCTEVEAINWSEGRVHVLCRSTKTGKKLKFEARKLVVTLPVGVLKNSAIQWDPMPKTLSLGLSGLEMGHVQRLVFQFRSRFWENLSKSEPVTFLHSGPHFYFPTWWTSSPLRTPQLVAWQGGPKAFEMRDWSKDKMKRLALETLAHLSRRTVQYLSESVVGVYSHNWSQDPFSQGAYTYIRNGGLDAAKALSKSIKRTLYFAGEGTCMGSSRGTVHGAIRSGKRIAAEISTEG